VFSNHPSCQAHAKHFSTCRILLSEVFPTPAPSYRKKLIEVALPLEAINAASAREKSIRHGHPSTLHLWWARRPLAACRAVLFASIVDDPSSRPEEFPTEEAQEQERQRLFGIIERLVLWENTNNEEVLNEARQEILKAHIPDGAQDNTMRTVSENCKVLKFKSFGFEEE
jgi:adenine-specific DNA methylase